MGQSAEQTMHDGMMRVEELLIRLTTLRRNPRYRQLLAEGTAFEGRITTMRILRAIDDLCRSGADPSIREVAERLGMEQSNASRSVDIGVERGLVSKRQSDEDARRTSLTLTSEGREAIHKLDLRRSSVLDRLAIGWDPGELESLGGLLEKLCSSYEDVER